MVVKVRVGLVYGGRSGEHEVSLQTALAVLKSFDYDFLRLPELHVDNDSPMLPYKPWKLTDQMVCLTVASTRPAFG